MIDYHCHLLPGLDDGARTTADSLAMARLLVGVGCTEVHCTPHCIRGSYDNTPAVVRAAVRDLQETLDRAGIILKLRPGMEYHLDEFFPAALEDPLPLGESRLLLVEAPLQADPEMIVHHLRVIVGKGFIPLMAHPERCRLFDSPQAEGGFWSRWARRAGVLESSLAAGSEMPDLLTTLVELGGKFQGNLGSLAGYYGHQVRQRAFELMAAGRYSCFGSDGHNPASLQSFLGVGFETWQRLAPGDAIPGGDKFEISPV